MQTKIVYTLISDSSDYYLEQALISVFSLRKHNPEATVELVVDKDTAATLIEKRSKIKEYVTSVIEIDVPIEYDKKSRSRFLKTNLRQLVKGDYLFIDCDTVICGKLDEIDAFDGDLAAVSDINGPLPLVNMDGIKRCEVIGFHGLEGQPYFNSGVMLVRDTSLTHQFYEQWFTNWKKSTSKGVTFDQPALCQTNVELGKPMKELPGIWNCQFKYRQGYALLSDALIMHYFNPNGSNQWTYPTDSLFLSVKKKGIIDATIKKMLDTPKSLLYTVMTIDEESAYQFFNSEMIDVYFNNPTLYRFVVGISQLLNKPFKSMSRLKSFIAK